MIRIFTLTIAAMFLLTEAAFAAAYIKFDGVDGEAKSSGHEKWIEICATRRRASVVAQDISFTKPVDRSTPLLNSALTRGQVFPEVILEQPFGQNVYQIKLQNVIITSITVQSDGDDRPTEEVTFNFSKIEWNYKGGGKNNTSARWDFETGRRN